jgi:iron complex outermembrane recepter protein
LPVLRLVVTLLGLALVPSLAIAQEASVRGRVSDRQGGVVVGAVIQLTPAEGASRTSYSGSDGTFAFEGLRGGDYTLQINSPGFASFSRVMRVASEPADLTITLDIAGLSETVGVIGTGASTLSVPAPTASRLGLTPLETPASLTIITGETIRQRGDMTLEDAETRMVGITSQGAPGNGGTSRTSRGFGGLNSLMKLYDGVQLLVASGTVTFPFDTWSVERVEFLGGPASVMYGNGAIGGVVNVVPRRPNRFTTETAARVVVGSDNTWRGAFGRGGPINDRAAYRFDVSHNRSDGWVERGESQSTAVSGAFTYAVTPTLDLTLAEDFGYQEPTTYFGTPLINGRLEPVLKGKNFNVADAHIWYKDNWTQVKAEWRPRRNVLIRNNVNVLTSHRFWHDVEQYSYVPATGLVSRTSYIEIFHDQRQYGEHADAVVTSTPFGKTNTTSVAFDYDTVRFLHTNNSPYGGTSTVPLDIPNPGTFINLAGTSQEFRSFQHHYATSIEDRLVLNAKLSLVAGGRFDHYQIDRDALRLGTSAGRTFRPTNGRAGMVYSVRQDLSLYGQYATATDAVSTLLTLSPEQQLYDLTPGRQIEFGAKQSIANGRGEWTVAGYQIVKEKLLVPDPNNPVLRQQIGKQSSRGFEGSAALLVGGGLRVEANAALLDARYDDFTELVAGVLTSWAGRTPTNVPERIANLWLTWTTPWQWQVQGGLRYMGSRFLNNANNVSTPANTLVDAGVRRRLTDSLNLDLRATNLLDRFYLQSVSGAPIPLRGRMGAPRTIELSLNTRF